MRAARSAAARADGALPLREACARAQRRNWISALRGSRTRRLEIWLAEAPANRSALRASVR